MITSAMTTLSTALRDARADLADRAHEVSTGRPRDVADAVGAGNMPAYAAAADRAMVGAARAEAADTAEQRLETQLTALSRFKTPIRTAMDALVKNETLPAPGALLDDMTATLNTESAGRALFGGAQVDRAPLPTGADWAMSLARTAYTGTGGSVTDKIAAVRDAFLAPGGAYDTAVGSLGGAPDQVPGASGLVPATARDPALRTGLAGMALAGLAQETGSADVRRAAIETLGTADQALAGLEGTLGARAARADSLGTQAETRAQAAEMRMREMEGVSLEDSTIGLIRTSQHIERLYATMARISELSLVNYLR